MRILGKARKKKHELALLRKKHLMQQSFIGNLLRRARPIVDRVPAIAGMYRRVRDERALGAQPIMTPLGFRIAGNVEMEQGTFEREEVRIVQQLLKQSDVMINVGANIGYYCCLALSSGVRVVAFEPVPLNLRYLIKNVDANGFSDAIEIFPIALTDRSGVVSLFGGGHGASMIPGWSGTAQTNVGRTPANTIDNVLSGRFEGQRCLIIVDIEGAESTLIKGASQFLARDPKPVWMIEVCVTEHQPNGVAVNPLLLWTFDQMWAAGYDAFAIGPGIKKVFRAELEKIQQTGVDSIGSHNFLFFEPGAVSELEGVGLER